MMFNTYLSVFLNRFNVAFRSIKSLSEKRVVSKPQLLSRLRYVDIVKRCDETVEEKAYRTKYESLQEWNNQYWAENNELFNLEKKQYIEKNFGTEVSQDEALSHDQLAAFYQDFLQRNRLKHVNYNKVWYYNHMSLLLSSMNAKLSRFKTDLFNR